ncbi:hypothetical protein EYF80_046525 [Liparis tanakae]|uniref:Uncharacterized protein n=1 Tax=Liparis tanakae TaxID=230148 RepID=A0A4Z2FQS8_9TELE|nr:hypothetical protein EYF80_046525 [Liparis tanakae]
MMQKEKGRRPPRAQPPLCAPHRATMDFLWLRSGHLLCTNQISALTDTASSAALGRCHASAGRLLHGVNLNPGFKTRLSSVYYFSCKCQRVCRVKGATLNPSTSLVLWWVNSVTGPLASTRLRVCSSGSVTQVDR